MPEAEYGLNSVSYPTWNLRLGLLFWRWLCFLISGFRFPQWRLLACSDATIEVMKCRRYAFTRVELGILICFLVSEWP